MRKSSGLIIIILAMLAASDPALAQGSGSSGAGAATGAAPGTNSLGMAQSSGQGAAAGSGTVGAAGGGGGRIDGTVRNGPPLPGDSTIRQETSPDSKADQSIRGICKGC